MPDRINEPPTLPAERAWSLRLRFASNTFIIQHTVTALLISHPTPILSYIPLSHLYLPLLPHAFSLPDNNRTSHPSHPFSSLHSFSILPANPLPYLNLPPSFSAALPFPTILFPRARDGISSPYASAPTCNMLAHDKIVSTPPPRKLQRVKAGVHQYHSPANRDRQPSTAW